MYAKTCTANLGEISNIATTITTTLRNVLYATHTYSLQKKRIRKQHDAR